MADKIRLLPEVVANQIAAGEVVNRPASVVKEMMETSVDAGATAITVSYRNGGKELIKVIDDGEGMSPLDARMAFDKHRAGGRPPTPSCAAFSAGAAYRREHTPPQLRDALQAALRAASHAPPSPGHNNAAGNRTVAVWAYKRILPYFCGVT